MPARSVIVKVEERGSTHEVEVLAESAHEACVHALHKFGKNRFLRGPGRDAVLELTLMSPPQYKIKVAEDAVRERIARQTHQRRRRGSADASAAGSDGSRVDLRSDFGLVEQLR